MPIPNEEQPSRRFLVARVKEEVFAIYAGETCTSMIRRDVAQELGLSFGSRDASIAIEAENKIVTMVIAVSSNMKQELELGTDFLYLLDCWS